MIQNLNEYSIPAAYLLIRIILGIVFISSGYDKLMRIGIGKVKEEYALQLQKYRMPAFVFSFTAFFSTWAELIGGILILFGLFKFIALSVLGIDLVLVTLAMVLLQPLYDLKLVFARLLLILILFVGNIGLDLFSLDYLFFY